MNEKMIHTKKKMKSKTKSKTINKTKKKVSVKQADYPYFKNYVSRDYILKELQKLKNYNPIFLKNNPTNRPLNKFNGRLVIFREDYNKNKSLYGITDYFSQYCRVRCINNLKSKDSPYDYFQKNKDKIYQAILSENKSNKTIGYEAFSLFLYKNTKQCTNFNTTVVISILKLLKPKRYLDPSAGWGDRLIGAIAYGCEYTGVDPSNCMNPIYHKIIDELVPRNRQNNYNIIQSGFETAIVESNYYDLVFTSPPFFDFELYENNASQSVEKFNTLEKWLYGFLFPLTEKAYHSLTINGHFGIYISDYTGISFTKEMFKYINENLKGFKYQGDIHFWTPENKKVVRTIFFWKKIK
jgi:hypothetical protein